MKRVETVGIGGRSFVIDRDGYNRLKLYLQKFRGKIEHPAEREQVMVELEERIAELFLEEKVLENSVISLDIVNRVISQLGMPDGSTMDSSESFHERFTPPEPSRRSSRKLYRDMDRKVIGGVTGGLAHYFDIDIILVRVIFLVLIMGGGVGFWGYIILWVVLPKAVTAFQRCEMRGIPFTAENLNRYRYQG